MPDNTTQPKKHSLLANLSFNIIIPTVILSKLSGDNYLGPVYSVIVALAFPVIYGARDYFSAHKPNFFSILGVISVILTGSMSLLKLPPHYIAIKDAAVPGLLGLATLISIYTRYPLVRTFLYNDQILQIDKVSSALQEHNATTEFERHLAIASYLVAGSFFLSAILNYILAKIILVSPPGTPELAQELGKMTALSFPVIALPCTLVLAGTLYYLLNNIQKLTQLTLEEIVQDN
ncbi:MAG TPA: VC0807 family protein [Spongiibacteraceae bacterium]|nr:VC0807 family protein [Spongiibacteraceae bacterium]